MATEAPVNIAPPECSPVGSTATDSFPWQPDSLNMHVTRPKSAKGRTRPRLHKRLGMEGCSGRAPASLPPAIPCESPSSHKPGACTPGSPDQGAPGEIPELLQQAPFGVSSSLNKYPVLPSINRRTLEEGCSWGGWWQQVGMSISGGRYPFLRSTATAAGSGEGVGHAVLIIVLFGEETFAIP